MPLGCPFRAATGLPCPFCGGTRAFALASRGDGSFLRFNAVWVALAALAVLAGAVLLAAAARGGRFGGGRPGGPVAPAWRWPAAVLALLAVAWAWALVHADTILEG